MDKSSIFIVKNVILRHELIDTKFACDLYKCKGACCTLESEYGAPLLEEEISEINDSLEFVKKYLSDSHLKKLESDGFFENKNGELMIISLMNRECIFAYYEDSIAKCALEKAFVKGETKFRKPISCHLFPIRVGKFGGDILRYEEFSECKFALEKGKQENINLLDFCKEALIRLYDKNWYSQLKESIGK